MGIDTEYWLIARTDAALDVTAPTTEYLDSPELEATYLLSQLRPAGAGNRRDRVASAYLKNSIPPNVANWLDALAARVLQTAEDRLLLFSSVDGEHGVITWARDGTNAPPRRLDHELDWTRMAPTFVPDEPAVGCAVFTNGSAASVDIRLARGRDSRFKDGLVSCLTSGGLFFWPESLSGLKGIAVATQKFASRSGYFAPIVLAYQTRIEGCFAWVCLPDRAWPKHVRLPVSLSSAPGDLIR
jgi:hypothetical protein